MQATIALAGNPNSGKTTLFNALTGARQHVGNYPGVTVEKKEGLCTAGNCTVHIVDLPGTYSLTAYSQEEMVAREYLAQERPDMVIDTLDASNLERHLYLVVQLLEMGLPLVLALNMVDVAKARGMEIDSDRLSQILGVPVIPTIARTGKGKQELLRTATDLASTMLIRKPLHISYGADLDQAILEMESLIKDGLFLDGFYNTRWVAIKYLENDEDIISRGQKANPVLSGKLQVIAARVSAHVGATLNMDPESLIADYRWGFIRSVMHQGIITRANDSDRLYLSDKIDKVLTNRFAGPLIMLGILFGLYQIVFTYSATPVGWMEGLFGWLSDTASAVIPPGMLQSLVVSGIIDGVGGVMGFVPLIMFMFLGIAIMEDTGYLARVAYMLDRVFKSFGLHGSSVMAYVVSGGIAGGCAVPGVMATRTLRSPKERLATLLTAPYMNCGAKLPVFALLIAAFFPAHEALMMFGITLLAWTGALIAAKILRMTVLRGESTPFVMELPPYRLPTFRGLATHTWERTWQYAKKAGTVILAISILLWVIMTFPGLPDQQAAQFEDMRQQAAASYPAIAAQELENAGDGAELSESAQSLAQAIAVIDSREAQAALRYSVAGKIGGSLEGVTKWAGFDWRTNIALVGGFAAKEVVVSALSTAYSLGETDPEEYQTLSQTLSRESSWSPAVALALIIFTMFYAPCFVTVICIVRESGSWKWGAFSVIFNTAVAFALAVIVYQTGSFLGY
ncbi:MAG: ferrous iron transport protein B [Desulfatibacillum sp.]|nr:ferrous iron transport protein B [Desulfatibacillum sp.]